MKIQTLCAPLVALTLVLSACAPPEDQQAKDEAAATADQQAKDLEKAQADLAAAQEEAQKKQEELSAAKERAVKAERSARQAEDRRSPPAQSAPAPAPVCQDCGTIASINEVRAKGQGSGLGAVAGAVIGGVVGHQFGGGKGKDVATGVGAVAGGVAGHQIERSARSTTYYEVGVRMENGGYQTVKVDSASGLAVGTAVRVDGNNLQLR